MYIFFRIVYYSIVNILYTLRSPFFWVVVVIISFQYKKIGKMEKEVLGRNKTSLFHNVLMSIIFGVIGGVMGSVLFIYFGTIINPKDFYFILPLAVILSMLHPKYMCFSYAGGIISLANLFFGWPNVNITGIIYVIGVLHLIESFLILVDGQRGKTPTFMERQGQVIGGFNMNRIWPVPFTIFMGNGQIYPVTIIAILGYGDYSLATYPEKKSKETASLLAIYSLVLLYLVRLSNNNYLFKYMAALFAPLGHEMIIMLGRRMEEEGAYIFAETYNGVKILDTLPKSIGEEIGLRSGDILLSINGKQIHHKKDIEDILYYRPKVIQLKILNRKGRIVTKEYEDYKNSINSLGIVVVSSIPEYDTIVEYKKYKKNSF